MTWPMMNDSLIWTLGALGLATFAVLAIMAIGALVAYVESEDANR